MSLRTRITLLTLALLAFSLFLIGTSVYGLLWGTLHNNLRNDLREAADRVVQQAQRGGQLDELALSLNLFMQVDILSYPQARAEEVGDYTVSAYKRFPPDALLAPSLRLSTKAYSQILHDAGAWSEVRVKRNNNSETVLLTLARYFSDGRPFGYKYPVIVIVGAPTEEISFTLSQFAQTYTATALLVLILGGYMAFRLVRRTLEPLEWVAKRAEQISTKPEKLPEPEGKNEVASLVKSLNSMLARLDHAWETQGRFLADASHELRTPVTAILGHVSYLVRRTQISDQQRESLEIIKRESERMQKLVGDLLELSKSGGSWKVELGPVHLETVLEEIKEDYGKSFEGKIEVEAPETLWVQGDPERLHQVIANLVSNAIKAGSSRIRLVVRDLKDRVVIRIEDNGEGIPAESLPHLFERFFRVDKARDRERGGSGLGLAIVRSIVEAHGGSVWAESELGKGSVFNVSLRRATAPQPELR